MAVGSHSRMLVDPLTGTGTARAWPPLPPQTPLAVGPASMRSEAPTIVGGWARRDRNPCPSVAPRRQASDGTPAGRRVDGLDVVVLKKGWAREGRSRQRAGGQRVGAPLSHPASRPPPGRRPRRVAPDQLHVLTVRRAAANGAAAIEGGASRGGRTGKNPRPSGRSQRVCPLNRPSRSPSPLAMLAALPGEGGPADQQLPQPGHPLWRFGGGGSSCQWGSASCGRRSSKCYPLARSRGTNKTGGGPRGKQRGSSVG